MLCTHVTCEDATKGVSITKGNQCVHVSSCMGSCCMTTIYLEGCVMHCPSVHILHRNQCPAKIAAERFNAAAGASDVFLVTRPFFVGQQTSIR